MNYKKHYDSLSEFYADMGGRNAPHGHDSRSKNWIGADDETIKATRFSWAEPFDKADPHHGIGGSAIARRWSDYDGDDMDMGRMMEGRPCLSRRFLTGGDKQRRIVRINHNFAFDCETDAGAIKKNARDMMQRIDQEETNGNRVEVYAVAKAIKWTTTGDDLTLEIRLKSPDEPLQIERVAAAFAPWFLRYWFFIWQDEHANRIKKTVKLGRGTPSQWEEQTTRTERNSEA